MHNEGPFWDNSAQGTVEWLKARQGLLTASNMASALKFLKGGKESEERRQLKIDILAERMTSLSVPHYVNDAMKWGIEKEDEARDMYSCLTGNLVTPCGLAVHGGMGLEYFGASPDGLLDDGIGLIEIKCPTTATHLKWLLAGVVPEQHQPQMLAQLACTRRKYVDFVTYDPRMPEPQNIMIRRFEPTHEQIAEVEESARMFLGEVEQMWDLLTNGSGA